MKYGHVIDPARGFIYQVFDGAFSTEQIMACTRCLWNDPAYSKTFNGIADITHMEPIGGMECLHLLIDFLKGDLHLSTGRWAVITATPRAAAGSMLYKREMLTRHVFETFSTWESARGFLQLDITERPEPVYFPEALAASEPPPAIY